MQRLSRGPKLPLLRARSFRFDRRCRSLSVSATRPVRHSAPSRLSMIARSHEVDLVDTWRADSQSLSVARLARNYPMLKEVRYFGGRSGGSSAPSHEPCSGAATGTHIPP